MIIVEKQARQNEQADKIRKSNCETNDEDIDLNGTWLHKRIDFAEYNCDSDSKDTIEVEFKDEVKNGRGKFVYSNGDTYSGEWKDNKRHGKGKNSHRVCRSLCSSHRRKIRWRLG